METRYYFQDFADFLFHWETIWKEMKLQDKPKITLTFYTNHDTQKEIVKYIESLNIPRVLPSYPRGGCNCYTEIEFTL